jgi:translation initiation factor IF-1
MAKDDVIELYGTVREGLKDAHFRVKIQDTDTEIIAHVSGKIRKNNIRIIPGDVVKVEMSAYDMTKGRIVFRERV